MDGTEVGHFLGVSCFAEKTVLPEQAVIKVDSEIDFATAALAGCALMSGVGAVVNSARVTAGSSVIVFGCGGVGLSVVMGAVLSGASQVIAVDLSETRLDLARRLGATDTIVSGDATLSLVHELSPEGVDFAFEVVGRPELVTTAMRCVRRGGEVTTVGLPPQSASYVVDALDMVISEKVLRGSVYGSSRPINDFAWLVDLLRRRRIPADEIPLQSFRLDDINDAFAWMGSGAAGRAVIRPNDH